MADQKKDVTPYGERSPGRPKGQKDMYPRKKHEKMNMRKKRAFLKALEDSGSISYSAGAINASRGTIYAQMKIDENFKRMVEEARARAFGGLEEYAYRRVKDGETTTKKDANGDVIETIHKPASAALVGRLLDATETYKKESNNNHLHIHQESKSDAVEKLAAALNIPIKSDEEVIDGEYTEE